MLTVNIITRYLDELFPPAYQEEYDNSGLLLGDPEQKIEKVLLCLDVTEKVIDDAISSNCRLIISHHPFIFTGLKRITGRNATERIVQKAILNNIAIYAIHTNLDNHINGLNQVLASKLGLINLKILKPRPDTLRKIVTFCPPEHAGKVRQAMFDAGAGKIGAYDSCSYNTSGEGTFRAGDSANPFVGKKNELHFEKELKIEAIYPVYLENEVIARMIAAHPYEEVAYDILLLGNSNKYIGSGIIGNLPEITQAALFLEKVKQVCKIPVIKYAGDLNRSVKRVALCGGSGSFLLKDALSANADIFLTGDLKYHDYFAPEGRMVLADIGHFESEQFSVELIEGLLVKKFPNFAVLKTKENTNPVRYF